MVDDELLTARSAAPEPAAAPDRRRGAGPVVIAAVAVASLAIGFGLGTLRSSSDLDRGSSATTSLVERPAGGATTSAVPTTTAVVPVVPPATATITFDGPIPDQVGGATVTATGWTTADGAAVGPTDPLPADAALPRPPGDGSSLVVGSPVPLSAVAVRLATPTAFSGLGLGTGPDRAWQLVASPELDQLRLFELTGGRQEQRAYVDVPIVPGTVIGLFVADGGLGVTVDGRPVLLQTFFGPAYLQRADDPDRSSAELLVGGGAPRFDDLAVG